MSTELWTKFQQAVRSMLPDPADAAIATYLVSDSSQQPAEALGEVTLAAMPSPAPNVNTAGVNVAGLKTINALLTFDDIGPQTGTVRIFYGKTFTGLVLWGEGEDVELDLKSEVQHVALPPIDVEGYDRVAFAVLTATAQVNSIFVFPFTEAS